MKKLFYYTLFTKIVNHEDIISVLSEFRIERDEIIFYITLLQTGSSTVNMLSSKLGIERGKAYRMLHRLQNLGLVSTTFSSPASCMAVEPQRAIDGLVQKRQDEIITLKKLAVGIIEELDKFKNNHTISSQLPSFYIIQGRSNVYGRIGKMIEEAKKIVYIATTIDDVSRMYYTAIPENIRKAVSCGVKVNLLIHEGKTDKINDLGAGKTRTGKLPAENRMVITEDRLVLSGKMSSSMSLNDDADSVMYTNSIEIVKNMESLFLNLWDSSRPKVKRVGV